MRTFAHRARRLLALLATLVALVVASPAAPAAHAQQPDTWQAWHLKVTFPGGAPQVIYTSYRGTDDPPAVISWSQLDITPYCTVVGALPVDAEGYAKFNGSSYIRCQLPPKPTNVTPCSAGSFWAAADFRLGKKSPTSPIFEGLSNGNTEMAFRVLSSGLTARTRLVAGGQAYTTSPWPVDITGAGNRTHMGTNGPTMVAVTDFFDSQGIYWLDFMTNWQRFFESAITGDKLGNLAQAPDSIWQSTVAAPLWSHPNVLFIGYSPTTGTYFNGDLRAAEIDPPGCYGD